MADPFRPPTSQDIQSGLLGEIQSEVSLEATPLLRFVLNNIRLIVAAVVVLVVSFIAFGAWQWHTLQAERDAQMTLGRILISTSGTERVAALENFLTEAPKAIRLGVQLELASSALAVQDFDRAAAAYGALFKEDSRGPVGLISAVNQADVLQRMGNPAQALTVLDALAKVAPENMLPGVREAQASCAEQTGDLARALAAYEALVSGAEGVNTDFYQAKIADLKKRLATQS